MHPILQKFLPSSYTVSSTSSASNSSPSSSTTQTIDNTSHKYVLMKSESPNHEKQIQTQKNSPTTTTATTNATKKSKKKKKYGSDLNLLYRLMHFKMPMILLSVALFVAMFIPVLCEPTVQKPTYIVESNKNPYTSYSNRASKQQMNPSASELKPQFASTAFNSNIANNNNNRTSFIRRSPQFPSNVQYSYKPSANSHVLFGVGRQASAVVENLTTAETTLRKEKRQILVQEPEPTVQQQAEDATRHYQCDSIIHDANFQIESPHYPAMYPINRICSYYVARSRQDVCQIEVTISDMDIEDTPQCTADYLDLGGGQQERLCGLMLRNSKRLIMFPSNGSYIRITFHSDSQNSRPYRGFSADVRQLSNSCFYPYHGVANGTQQQVIHSVYGQRLYPPTTRAPQPTVYFGGPPPAGTYIPGITPPGNGQPGQLYPPYLVNTKSPGGQTTIVVQQPNQQLGTVSFNVIPRQQQPNNNTPIYLASYCDVYLGEVNGELRSPGYPFGYPTNHSCIYTVKKAFDDVCQLELIFHHFDIQTPDSKKDLTDTCHGDYLELPDHSRLCGYYNQAMSREHVLKKFYLFPDQSDYLFLQFVSDQNQTPDGSGFWIESKQLRNTCVDGVGGVMPVKTNQVKCDREIIGKYSNTDRVYSPNFPNLYPARAQCVYFIQPADSRTCEFELDLVQFQLEDVRPTNSIQELGQCTKDFLQLPDRTRICGRTNFRKIFNFPKYHDRTAMFYFTSDEQIQERGFEIVVRQIPNTCSNFTGQSGSNQNVYVINDPNIRYNPTPVYTYHNASGIQPYNPLLPQQPPIITQVIPSSPTYVKIPGTKKITNTNQLGPSYSIVPSVLNDPRNVDSSGTIPLYYANGTLATRIPPLKPVDMITFLKKGKTFAQKSGSSFVPGGGSFIGFDSSKQQQFGNLNQYNPPGNVQFGGRSSNNQGMVTSSSNTFDLQPFQPQLQPTYNCDQVLSRNVEYIRSPNFPSNYPPVTRCIYTILKSENSVCQVRLQLLTMDMEYTAGCKNDYFQVETTGEKICGRLSQPETRIINYYGHARDIRLIFNSDRQNTAQGFEVRIEQMPNSCDGAGGGGQNASLASMVGAARTFTPQDLPTTRSGRIAPISNQFQPTPSTELDTSRFPIPQALVTPAGFPNRSAPLQALPPSSGIRICRTSALMDTYFESDNFPNPYPTNTDCVYKIFRSNRNVCRLEIELLEFDVGNEIFDSSANGNSLPMSSVITTCPNDFLEIDQVKYCGRRPLQKIAVNFPRMIGEISFRFLTVSPDPFNGFRLKIRQIDENCRQNALGTFGSDSDPMSGDFSPATIESCPKLSDPATGSGTSGTSAINEEVVRIQSPKFGLITNLGYEPFLDCHYLVQKSSPSVCALEIRFESFSLEESRSCTKDYLEINGNGLKLCGKMPIDTIRTFDFASNSIRMHFHTDADRNDTGFAMILKQIRC